MIRIFIIYIAILQLVGILGFIYISSILDGLWLKILIGIMFLTCTLMVIFNFFSAYKMKHAVLFSGVFAFHFVFIYQIIGFCFYPGLVKGVSVFSYQHMRISAVFFIAMFIFYNFCHLCLLFKKSNHD